MWISFKSLPILKTKNHRYPQKKNQNELQNFKMLKL